MKSLKVYAKKTITTLKEEGFRSLAGKVYRKFNPPKPWSYQAYIECIEPKKDELAKQRQESKKFQYRPKFSIVIPLYKTPENFFRDLMDSLLSQTYDNFEICLADAGACEGYTGFDEALSFYMGKHKNIKYKVLEKNMSIAENTNAAIELSEGDYIVFCDHDDTIAPFSLYEFAKEINKTGADVLYSDQDFITVDGTGRTEPLWKPEFDIDFLRCCNYISHLFCTKKSLLDTVGYLDPAYDGSQDYELTLRLCEKAEKIVRIPKMLYHWRLSENSTALNPESKLYAYENGAKALNEHYKRVGIPATVEHTEHAGKYHTTYHWEGEPLISILIPNKDHVSDLDKCIRSIYNRSEYKNFEIVIVENNSEEKSTFSYYDKIKAEYDNLTVLYYEGGFNYSLINNFGVKHCKGDYILLLNNDTEFLDGKLLKEMLGYIRRDDVGAVGARLFYENGNIQHAGVIIGYGGVAGHAFLDLPHDGVGNLGRVVSAMEYSAVTAAVLMTKKSVYYEVGELEPKFQVAFNDVDFCLKIRRAGYKIVYNPFAIAMHYESKSRGYEDESSASYQRFKGEMDLLKERWPDILRDGDPYYNPNLTTEAADFSVKRKWEWEREMEKKIQY